jgi:hypothetical protein
MNPTAAPIRLVSFFQSALCMDDTSGPSRAVHPMDKPIQQWRKQGRAGQSSGEDATSYFNMRAIDWLVLQQNEAYCKEIQLHMPCMAVVKCRLSRNCVSLCYQMLRGIHQHGQGTLSTFM